MLRFAVIAAMLSISVAGAKADEGSWSTYIGDDGLATVGIQNGAAALSFSCVQKNLVVANYTPATPIKSQISGRDDLTVTFGETDNMYMNGIAAIATDSGSIMIVGPAVYVLIDFIGQSNKQLGIEVPLDGVKIASDTFVSKGSTKAMATLKSTCFE